MTERLPEEHVEERLPVRDHLVELRQRLMRAVIAVVIGFGLAWVFHQELFRWLMEPYRVVMVERYPELDRYIHFRSVIEPIAVYLKTSLLAGFILATPYVLLQGWLFVAPGLYQRERRYALPFLFFTIVFFTGGVLFCRFVVLRPAMEVLIAFGGVDANPAIMMQEYFAFTSRLLFVFGLLFELPVVISFLALAGLVTHRGLIRNWKYAAVVAFVVGAMLTPPDPLTQVALAVPLVLLYFLSVVLAFVISGRRDDDPELHATSDESHDGD